MNAPKRFKDRGDWSPADCDANQQTGAVPETDEYRAYVRKVHEDAGLEPPEQTAPEKALDDMGPEDHFQRISKGE